MRWQLRSKIINAIITETNINYVGSITIDKTLVEKAGFKEGEKVLVASYDSGERIETYIILGPPYSGEIVMNGPAALKIRKGEKVTIMGFELTDKKIRPKVIMLDRKNTFLKYIQK